MGDASHQTVSSDGGAGGGGRGRVRRGLVAWEDAADNKV